MTIALCWWALNKKMAFLKIYRHARKHGLGSCVRKLFEVAPRYIGALHRWRIRRCQCCDRVTVFLCDSSSAESRACLFCSANERYELLAIEIKARFGEKLCEMDVLELDPHSPLREILSHARIYTRSFYEAGKNGESLQVDGAVCEDITALSFRDESFDLIISSDVLEHVPLLDKAFSETARVLRPTGAHLFTVPPRRKTVKRSELVDGKIRYIEQPEYHRDPLSPQGILAFWDIGADLPQVVSTAGLNIRVARGPAGDDGRVVWIAERGQQTHLRQFQLAEVKAG
jgi:SAM-dependent methyltransferase